MRELLRKGLYLGLGAARLGKKQTQSIVNELTKKGAVTAREGKALIKKVLAEAQKERKRLQKLGRQEVQKALREVGIVSFNELERLKKRIRQIRKEQPARNKKRKRK